MADSSSNVAVTAASTGSTPLDLVIRFSTSDQDVIIHLADPARTTALTLKTLIREKLDFPARDGRLRLICAGKVIPDTEALSRSLGRPTPPTSKRDGTAKSDKARGKLPVKDDLRAARVYIHCSIGDSLSATELQDEKRKAAEVDAALHDRTGSGVSSLPSLKVESNSANTTTPAPQGFDRLLSAGFTAAEIATLRTQFRAIQAHSHTPDTMPTGQALLALEEQWLEQSNSAAGPGMGAEELGEDGLDDLLWGTIMGFFWPVGMVCWLLREEGLWSRRRQMTVMIGFFINVMFGIMRVLT